MLVGNSNAVNSVVNFANIPVFGSFDVGSCGCNFIVAL